MKKKSNTTTTMTIEDLEAMNDQARILSGSFTRPEVEYLQALIEKDINLRKGAVDRMKKINETRDVSEDPKKIAKRKYMREYRAKKANLLS